jgi:hypothetical protein
MNPSSPTESNFTGSGSSNYVSSSQWSSARSSSSPEDEEDVITPESDDNSDITIGPKIEELDDDEFGTLNQIEEAKLLSPDASGQPAARKRGRPRKHPVSDTRKTAHTRSKTGCATCRRRKKRCDERKPSCLACEKNNVECEGYEPKRQWRGGKEKEKTVAVAIRANKIPPSLPPFAICVDGAVDQLFLQHFTSNVSQVLSVNDYQNPFMDHIFPMSLSHPGLMHSLLSLSGSCLIAKATTSNWEWEERQAYHGGKAMALLSEDLRDVNDKKDDQNAVVSDPSIAQTLILCLETVCSGDRTGLYRFHLNALKTMLTQRQRKFPNEKLRHFILEFLLYHDYSASITAANYPIDQRSLDLMADFQLPEPMMNAQTPEGTKDTLLGIHDGLFGFISRIRALRDQIRARRAVGLANWWDDPIMNDAFAIDNALRAWTCAHKPDSPRYAASLLYRQCAWIYLHRTIQLSRPSAAFKQAVGEGLTYLRMLPDTQDGSTQSIFVDAALLAWVCSF